jgi:hypothetical protein
MPQTSEVRKPHALSVYVRLLENASSQFKYDIYNRKTEDTPNSEDTQLKIHMSPSSAPDLRIAQLSTVH